MASPGKYPRLRVYVKRGKAGQVWTSYAYDMRGTGRPDVALGSDYAEALRRWAEIHLDAPRHAGTLEEAFKGWEQQGIEHRPDGRPRSPETVKGYRKCLAVLRPVFGAARWEDVTLPTLRKYVQARSAKGRARQEMQLLSVIWGWARLEGLTVHPWPAVDMQKTGWKGAPGVRQVEVTDEQFAAIYRHADQTLRDFLDLATATGLRGEDVCRLTLGNVRGTVLAAEAGKTGKRAEFDLDGSILGPLIERRRAMRKPEHLFILAAGRKAVSYRAVSERFSVARAKAAAELPACADVWLRDMRKRAGQLADDLAAASKLLQHSSIGVTQRHYRQGDKLRPVR